MRRRDESKNTIEVGEPVKHVPPPAGSAAGRYSEIYEQVDKLGIDDWLPVTCGSRKQAHRLRECAKLQKYKVKRRGVSVYIARNPGFSEPDSNGAEGKTSGSQPGGLDEPCGPVKVDCREDSKHSTLDCQIISNGDLNVR